MPNREQRPIDFKEAEKIFCGHFPRRDQPPSEKPVVDNDGDTVQVPRF
jgi:hypothetical protein